MGMRDWHRRNISFWLKGGEILDGRVKAAPDTGVVGSSVDCGILGDAGAEKQAEVIRRGLFVCLFV
jgi:hypothetical protein